MAHKDVTQACDWANPDDELLPLTQCVCGVKFAPWDANISIYDDDPRVMPCCGAKLYFSQRITIWDARDKYDHEVLP